MAKEVEYKLEADLCAAFIGIVTPLGWRCYPEQHGFDIYVVVPEVGHVGIEAKLKLNLKVISQVLPHCDQWTPKGPDFRAVLVPDTQEYVASDLCNRIGVTVLTPRKSKSLYSSHHCFSDDMRWHPTETYEEPKYVSDSIAGSPCPVTLTPWKQKALRLIARIEIRGFVTREDFKDLYLDPRRWLHAHQGWLVSHDAGNRFIRGDKLRFDADHPTAFQKIVDEEKEILNRPKQEAITKKTRKKTA